MSDKRRPDLIFTIAFRKEGRLKTRKAELFRTTQWPGRTFFKINGNRLYRPARHYYRVRVNGRWVRQLTRDPDDVGTDLAVTQSEFRDLLWRSIKEFW